MLEHALYAFRWWYDTVHPEAVFRLYLTFGCQRLYPFAVRLLVPCGQQPIDVLVLVLVERAILSYGLPCVHHHFRQMSVLRFLHLEITVVADVALFTIL